jgi:N4-gp56 family major capsid protein
VLLQRNRKKSKRFLFTKLYGDNMATSSYGLNHPLAVKIWSRKLFQEALKQCWLYRFMGKDSNSIIQIKEDTMKGPGDRIRAGLRMQLTGAGVEGDSTLEGNEEALTTYYDDIVINQLRHAVRSDGKMSEQRIPFSIREEARMGLQDWWSDRIDTAFFNQLGGNTAQTDTRYTGHQATVAPDSSHIVYGGSGTTEADVASKSANAKMTLTLIDYAVEKAKTATPLMRPVKVNGEEKFVLFLHPYQVTDLRTNTNTGQWLDIQKAAMAGSKASESPIYTGALGEYNGVIIHESTRVPTVTSTVYRGVFCGAQAGLVAFGQDNKPNKMTWVEELFDYGNQLGVSAGMIWGAKKTRFNNADFSTIVIATHAIPH